MITEECPSTAIEFACHHAKDPVVGKQSVDRDWEPHGQHQKEVRDSQVDNQDVGLERKMQINPDSNLFEATKERR